MALSPELLTIVSLASLGLAAFAVYLLVVSSPKGSGRLSDDRQVVQLLSQHDQTIARLKAAVRQLAGQQRSQAETMMGAVQRIGLIRYDAFEDMGGHLSFSAALLDAGGDGIVITSINGRQDTRCYAKPVEAWTSRHNLSEEEEAAIQQALTSPSGQAPAVRLASRGRARPGA
jgi:uncharacterized protein YlxW (UPF0749 family)